MICPACKREIPPTTQDKTRKPEKADPSGKRRTPKPEDAERADAPPAPCPQCGWSTMWNE
jgi:hypothetical protein